MASSHPSGSVPPPARRCQATTVRGRPCRAWAVPGDHYCRAHQPGQEPIPPTRRLETPDDVIADLLDNLSRLSGLLDRSQGGDDFLKLLSVYSRASTHLAGLMREQRRASGPPADPLLQAIGQALDELSEELGIQL
jgi:hypothetical protein